MSQSPIAMTNVLLESTEPLSAADKARFAYFGEGAKILPPYRILNPQKISIGDRTVIREGCHINAFVDLSHLIQYIDARYRDEFSAEDYRYEPKITLGKESFFGRFLFMNCTASITVGDNVGISERVFVGDHNHTFSHPDVPIIQQPNSKGRPVVVGRGTIVGVGVAILAGTVIGRNCLVGASSVCRGASYPDYAVIGPEAAKVLHIAHPSDREGGGPS